MPTRLRLRPGALLLLLASFAPGWAAAQPPPDISAEVWTHALAAHKEATTVGKTTNLTLTIIDYSLPATVKRLWVVDVISHEVLESEFVAHGEGSGDLFPSRFSNKDGTHQSSLGTFITGSTYDGVRVTRSGCTGSNRASTTMPTRGAWSSTARPTSARRTPGRGSWAEPRVVPRYPARRWRG